MYRLLRGSLPRSPSFGSAGPPHNWEPVVKPWPNSVLLPLAIFNMSRSHGQVRITVALSNSTAGTMDRAWMRGQCGAAFFIRDPRHQDPSSLPSQISHCPKTNLQRLAMLCDIGKGFCFFFYLSEAPVSSSVKWCFRGCPEADPERGGCVYTLSPRGDRVCVCGGGVCPMWQCSDTCLSG